MRKQLKSSYVFKCMVFCLFVNVLAMEIHNSILKKGIFTKLTKLIQPYQRLRGVNI